MKENKILHTKSSPYYLTTNRFVENLLELLKILLSKWNVQVV